MYNIGHILSRLISTGVSNLWMKGCFTSLSTHC